MSTPEQIWFLIPFSNKGTLVEMTHFGARAENIHDEPKSSCSATKKRKAQNSSRQECQRSGGPMKALLMARLHRPGTEQQCNTAITGQQPQPHTHRNKGISLYRYIFPKYENSTYTNTDQKGHTQTGTCSERKRPHYRHT